MQSFIRIIKQAWFTIKTLSCAIAYPVVSLIKTTLAGEPVSMGQLLFAFWRLFVWLMFITLATTAIGVPQIIAMLFLIDLGIVGVQIVSNAVTFYQEQLP